jgi:hypothetical protein
MIVKGRLFEAGDPANGRRGKGEGDGEYRSKYRSKLYICMKTA